MRPGLKQQFLDRWTKYFPGAELPLAFYYTDDPGEVELFRTADSHCVIEDIYSVRQGRSLSFDTKSVTCFGGKRYLGFSTALMPTRILPLLQYRGNWKGRDTRRRPSS